MVALKSSHWGYLLALEILLSACSSAAPIRVGFVADLTGANAALGVDGRDGVMLAVSEINSAGGVNGHPIELVVHDDHGTSQGAIAADKTLIQDEEVFVIVGHMTSGTMMAAWETYKDSGVFFISPTVSTPQLAGVQDNFFRLIPINSLVAEQLALHAATKLGLKRVAIFYDIDNAAFTDTYRAGFSETFTAQGGEIIALYDFSSQSAPDFRPALSELKGLAPDGIFIIASAFDTALIAQQAHLAGLQVQLLASNWSLTNDLVEYGGTAVDGIVAVVTHDENSLEPSYVDFKERFVDRFGREPTFAAGYGYEALLVLADALRKTDGGQEGLKEALLQTKDFQGVNGRISFDPYGDVSRTLYLISVRDGKFVTEQIFAVP